MPFLQNFHLNMLVRQKNANGVLTFAGIRLFTFKYLFPFDLSLRASSPAALAAGREKEGELATTSLEFEYLHRKSRCEMLIVEDDISNDVSSIFHLFSFWKSYGIEQNDLVSKLLSFTAEPLKGRVQHLHVETSFYF